MSSDEIAIHVRDVSKHYLLFDRPQDRLKQSIVPRLQRLAGRVPARYYRDFAALSDVSFDIRRGETVGIVGRNGSGKSTLLQIVCGTLRPNTGTVEVNGRIAALLELGAGFNADFTGRENVYTNAAILGLSRREIDARFDDIARFADIGDFIDQPIKTYSTGMVVRLAFAVIAYVDADILVIDEALAVGDAFFVQKCMRFLRRFMETGTILFVSHDMSAVINLCRRAIWLQSGTVHAIGSPKEVAEGYLESLYEAQQGATIVRSNINSGSSERNKAETEPVDQRLKYLNVSNLRNDIELFQFDPQADSFGKGGGRITDAQLRTAQGNPLTWCVGGEDVVLCVRCEALTDIVGPIIGFQVKDRLGQNLFSDNTYLTYASESLAIAAGGGFEAQFFFRMPILPVGDYSFCVALAEGTQLEHVQHHWIHDAVFFKSHSSSLSTGLIGIPMHKIRLSKC